MTAGAASSDYLYWTFKCLMLTIPTTYCM